MNKLLTDFYWLKTKFIHELHLRQPGFSCSACVPFTKHCEEIEKFRETGISQNLYRNELDKACVAFDKAYSDNWDLAKRNILKSLRNC